MRRNGGEQRPICNLVATAARSAVEPHTSVTCNPPPHRCSTTIRHRVRVACMRGSIWLRDPLETDGRSQGRRVELHGRDVTSPIPHRGVPTVGAHVIGGSESARATVAAQRGDSSMAGVSPSV
jgi:hypothetical protein